MFGKGSEPLGEFVQLLLSCKRGQSPALLTCAVEVSVGVILLPCSGQLRRGQTMDFETQPGQCAARDNLKSQVTPAQNMPS